MEIPIGRTVLSELADQFDRHLQRLSVEVSSYPDDASLWVLRPGVLNSGGTLAAHIAGNLNHWVGANLGANGYVRDREAEFSIRGLTRDHLVQQITEVRRTVAETLRGMDAETLTDVFPGLPERYAGASTFWFLSHLSIHLGYHLGQVNYHRRLLASGQV